MAETTSSLLCSNVRVTNCDETIFSDIRNRSTMPVQVFIGLRGCGKTYSGLRGLAYEEDGVTVKRSPSKFCYLRHTETQLKICSGIGGNPFKKLNANLNSEIIPKFFSNEKTTYFFDRNIYDKSNKDSAIHIGYGVALSTFGNMRGGDMSDVDEILFDEFIDPSKHVRSLCKDCGKDFSHLRETIGRNRELEGKPPLQIKLLSNSVSLDSPILLDLGIVHSIAHMIVEKQTRMTIKEKGVYIELIDNAKFRELKKKTTLYSGIDSDSEFVRQALNNEFVDDNFDFVRKKVALNEYLPYVSIADEVTIYQHKHRDEYFATNKSIQKGRFRYSNRQYDVFYEMWNIPYRRWILGRKILCNSYATKLTLDGMLQK